MKRRKKNAMPGVPWYFRPPKFSPPGKNITMIFSPPGESITVWAPWYFCPLHDIFAPLSKLYNFVQVIGATSLDSKNNFEYNIDDLFRSQGLFYYILREITTSNNMSSKFGVL